MNIDHVAVLGATTGLGLALAAVTRDRGATIVGLLTRSAHVANARAAGIDPVLLDPRDPGIGRTLVAALSEVDAVVLAAGTGNGGTPPERSPAALLGAAAGAAGVRRAVVVSALFPDRATREDLGTDLDGYLAAKVDAEQRLGSLGWHVLRPATLVDRPGTGCAVVTAGGTPARDQVISRADCAELIWELLLHTPPSPVWGAAEGTSPIPGIFRA